MHLSKERATGTVDHKPGDGRQGADCAAPGPGNFKRFVLPGSPSTAVLTTSITELVIDLATLAGRRGEPLPAHSVSLSRPHRMPPNTASATSGVVNGPNLAPNALSGHLKSGHTWTLKMRPTDTKHSSAPAERLTPGNSGGRAKQPFWRQSVKSQGLGDVRPRGPDGLVD